MKIEITVETNLKNAFIDFIEMKNKDKILTLDWDESGISWTDQGFMALYRGVAFNEINAEGRANELEDAEITAIQVYSDDPSDCTKFQICNLRVIDTGSQGASYLEMALQPLDCMPFLIRESI